MPSSISNSDRTVPLLPGALGLACASLLGYGLLFRIWHPVVDMVENMRIANAMTLERYAEKAGAAQTVLIGSSRMQLLPLTALGADYSNLSMAGMNPVAGLEVLRSMPRLPARVLIELNALDPNLKWRLTPEDRWQLKRIQWTREMAGWRQEFRPVNVLLSLIASPRRSAYDPDMFDRALSQRREAMRPLPFRSEVSSVLNQFGEQLRWCRAQDIEVIMVMMPMHETLMTSPRHTAIVSEFRRRFGVQQLRMLEFSAHYETMDGSHLSVAGAAAFCADLKRALE